MNILFELFRYSLLAYNRVVSYWFKFWDWFYYVDHTIPHNQYFLSDTHIFDATYETVPENTVYIEEWVQNGKKKCVIRYPGEEIPIEWDITPFEMDIPHCPWIWVGDKDTEIDLTQSFTKFLVPGNRITIELVIHLIRVTDYTNLVYIESGTFDEREFPGDGILIEAC